MAFDLVVIDYGLPQPLQPLPQKHPNSQSHSHSALSSSATHNVCQTEGGNFFNSCSGTCWMCGRLIAAPAWCLRFVWIFFFCFWPTASARCKKRGLLSQLFGEYLIEIYAKVNPSNGLLKKISLGDEMVFRISYNVFMTLSPCFLYLSLFTLI